MTASSPVVSKKKWHQYPYVWLLIGIPATSVILSMILIYLAVSGRDPLVADDYYKRGKAINQVLIRDKKAAELGVKAVLNFNKQDKHQVTIEVSSNKKMTWQDILQLKIAHATKSDLDQTLRMYRTSKNRYHGKLPVQSLIDGKWYLDLGTKAWRITAVIKLPEDKVITLQSSQ